MSHLHLQCLKYGRTSRLTVTFNVYLYGGRSYYFKTELYDEFRAGHILLGVGYAKTSLQTLLLHVEVYPLITFYLFL